MSKKFNSETMLGTFPEALAQDEEQKALAKVTADEFEELYINNNLASLYTRIDDLSEEMLDILAYDFKVDWWDKNYSIEEKRSTLKSSWSVHRKLGTPGAVSRAISAIYKNVEILEWWKYNGNSHYFKLLIDTGGVFADYEKLLRLIERVRFYKNKRSLIETIEFDIEKEMPIFYGLALQGGNMEELTVNYGGFDPAAFMFLTDISDAVFTDASGNLLLN